MIEISPALWFVEKKFLMKKLENEGTMKMVGYSHINILTAMCTFLTPKYEWLLIHFSSL